MSQIRNTAKKVAHTLVKLLEDLRGFYIPSELPLRTKLAFLFGTYESETSAYMRAHVRGGIAIDVGAHIGYFSRLLSRYAEHVYAFEPDPNNYALLAKNVARFSNITPIQMALSDAGGEADFFVVPNSTFRHSLKEEEGSERTTVVTTTLDAFMREHPGTVSFVKIDVEGLEDKVLSGMREVREKDHPVIIAEMPLNDVYTPVSPAIGRKGIVRNYLIR